MTCTRNYDCDDCPIAIIRNCPVMPALHEYIERCGNLAHVAVRIFGRQFYTSSPDAADNERQCSVAEQLWTLADKLEHEAPTMGCGELAPEERPRVIPANVVMFPGPSAIQ